MASKIHQTRIFNVRKHLEIVPEGDEFRLSADVTAENRDKLTKIGFTETPSDGQTVLPCILGPTSRFNAEGKHLALKDRPKEARYIRTVRWRWKQWAGRYGAEEREDFRDIWRNCYQRELIPPLAIELTYAERDGRQRVISPVFRHRSDQHKTIGHGINLFLELFEMCELIRTDMCSFTDLQTHKVNWRMLPPGEYPWKLLWEHLDGTLKRQSDNTRSVILDRQKTIRDYGPDVIYVGLGGFTDYLAYVFESRGLVVLESVKRDNAIYVFGRNWERVAQLSKAEVLNSRHHIARIIHAKGWKIRLAEILKVKDAA